MAKTKRTAKSKFKKGRFVERREAKRRTRASGESRLLLIFDAMGRNGSHYRTIIGNKPYITDKVISVKKGRGEKAVIDYYHQLRKRQTGKEALKKKGKNYDYSFSDDITAKFVRLAEISEAAGTCLYDVTVQLNDFANIELRDLDADIDACSMIRKVYQLVYDSQLIKDGIIVIEECDNSDVEFWSDNESSVILSDTQKLPRLHVHIITHLTEKEVQSLRDNFLKKQRSRILVKNYWDSEQEFTHLHEIEEEVYGKVPFAKPDPSNKHWMNQFTRKRFGKKYLYTRLPISLNYADYLTKQFHCGFTKDRTDTHIGLDGYPLVRERLAKLSKGIDKRVLPKRSSRRRL